jgi:hypothetical protein
VNPGFVSKLGSYGIAIEIDKYVEVDYLLAFVT